MNQPTRPHKEKEQVPWCIQFSGRDLLTAAWGSKKGADLLYHFLHKASWEKKNKHENETLKDIKFQESTSKALEKSGLSLGCFHTYLKHFVSVGYISTEAYSGEYIVHTEVIQQAFSAAPEKPVNETGKRRQPRSDSFNLKDCNFVTLPREDYEMLTAVKAECFNLKEMFQSLKDAYAQTLAEMKEMFQSLKQNATIHVAQEAESEAFSDLQSNALRDSESIDLEREDDCANAPLTLPFTPEEIAMIVRSRIPEGDAILLERLERGSHRIYRKSGRPIGELIPVGVDVSEGLLALITVDSTTNSTVDALPEHFSDSQGLPQNTISEQNQTETDNVYPTGYQKNTDVNTSSQENSGTRRRRERRSKTEKPAREAITVVVPAFTEGGQEVFNAWCSLFKVPIACGAKTIEAANALHPMVKPWSEHLNVTFAQLLDKIQKWIYKMDKSHYYDRGVKLTDVFREFEGWQSAMERHGYSKDTETAKEDPYSIQRLLRRDNPELYEEAAN